MSAAESINGHAVEAIEIDGDWRATCNACHAERCLSIEFLAFRCPAGQVHPDAAGRTWHTAAVLMGGHRHVTIRYGVEGQRANCGKVIIDDEQWPQLRSVLELLGDVAEAEA